MPTKTVMLEWPSAKFQVTEEGYELIKQLIREHQVCSGCGEKTDDGEHLLVCKRCLACVLADHPGLTFIGFDQENEEGNRIYIFRNEKGITLTSTQNHGDSPQEDVAYSIEQEGFVIPTTYKPFKSNEEIQLNRSSWKVYGTLSRSVVVLHYKDNNSKGRLEVDFLAYKGRNTIPFNRRTTEHQNLLDRARGLATQTNRSTDDASLFEIVSRLETATYNELLALLAEEPAPSHSQIELFSGEITAEQPVATEPVSLQDRRSNRRRSTQEETADATQGSAE